MSDGLDGKIRILFEDGKLAVKLSIAPDINPDYLKADSLTALIRERTVAQGSIDTRAIEALVESFDPTSNAPAEAVVARGRPPVHGRDGRLELDEAIAETLEHARKRIETAEEERERLAAEAQADAEGECDEPVSFYDQSAFCMVSKGQRIARVIPPTQGEEGLDVTGMSLPPRTGKPFNLQEDASIEVADDGTVTAACDGLIEHKFDILRVLTTLEVDGSVDFSTGNIVGFAGDVVVRKGVKDKFRIDVGGDVTIGELVEAAHICSLGSLSLVRGMAGRDKGSLSVGRDLSAKYLDSVEADVKRDALIKRELSNVKMRVGRDLDAPQATIMGGSFDIVRRCQAGQIGSESGTPTEIVLGKLPEQERLVKEAFEIAPALKQRIEKNQERLSQLESTGGKLTSQQAEERLQLQTAVSTHADLLGPLREKMVEIIRAIDKLAPEPALEVQKVLHQGIVLFIGAHRCEITTSVKGPLRIDLDEEQRPRLTDLTSGARSPLASIAKVARDGRFVDLSEIREACADLLDEQDSGEDADGEARAAA